VRGGSQSNEGFDLAIGMVNVKFYKMPQNCLCTRFIKTYLIDLPLFNFYYR